MLWPEKGQNHGQRFAEVGRNGGIKHPDLVLGLPIGRSQLKAKGLRDLVRQPTEVSHRVTEQVEKGRKWIWGEG